MKKITLTFKWDGKTVEKDVEGFEGGGCITATDFINKALGSTEEEQMKPSYYLPNPEGLDVQAKVYN
jgi:hypothetical protein